MLDRVVRILSRAALLLAVALLGRLSLPPTTRAHSETVESSPRPSEVVYGGPSEVTVHFSAPLAEGSFIQVIDEGFQRQDRGPTTIDPQDRSIMRAALGSLPEGGYTAQWTAVDARDGHRSRGSFTFSVRPAALGPRLLAWIDRHFHILLTGWVLKAGLTVFIGRWYVRRRAARKAAAEALSAVEKLWEDERS
ncbi:MAG TPA: copper resistance protein CopC [Anaerolineae bacterium]|nr:copper resistance protein CopC [Ardenticatenia bacterium]HQZ70095.1 copper resistance protein CopC [Anaerolineae bacterium]HRA19188.1 copper resistance protein CopC [Anaerolineae bacterium]